MLWIAKFCYGLKISKSFFGSFSDSGKLGIDEHGNNYNLIQKIKIN